MFRAQQNAFDDLVSKATDENLTSENWEYIMDVCDKVSTEDNGPKDVVASMIKRLAHRNANVQLYTLELANALSQNCGLKIHKELASRAFTDAMLRLANDRNTHQQVKAKILERMEGWASEFKDPDLGIMNDQYYRLKSQNPNLQPPSAPQKSRLTEVDRQKEEEELQMALKLSIQDKASQQTKISQQTSSTPTQAQPVAQQTQTVPVPSGTTAATVSRVRALFDFQATDPDELQFRKGDIIAVLESVYKDWWKGLLRGKTGIFPLNYVEKLADPTRDEIQREAQMEAEVFAEIKNVEKLLTLLSTSTSELNVRDNEEITKLYHSTLAIRPKLIELIGKYSQKKDEFTQLNERFIKSCRDYENLLDASMTQTQSSYQYGRQGHAPQGYGGYPPQPQADSQRYYAQSQPEQPYPPQSAPPANYPPRNGQAPFYLVPGHQPQQPSESQQFPQRNATPRVPSNPQAGPLQSSSPPATNYPTPHPQTGHRPQSTYSNPQELGTSTYDSPVSQPGYGYPEPDPYSNQPSQPPPQQYNTYAGPPSQSQQASYPAQPSQPPQPTYSAPLPPNQVPSPTSKNGGAGYPVIQDARTPLPSQGYKAYQRPDTSEGRPPAPDGPSAPPGAPQDFYRQSAY